MYICIHADSTISRKLVDTLIEFALHIHEYDKCIPSWIWQILCILLGGNRFVLLGGLMIHESFGINWSSDVLRRLQKFKKKPLLRIWKLLSNFKIVKYFFKFCGLLTISELYIHFDIHACYHMFSYD